MNLPNKLTISRVIMAILIIANPDSDSFLDFLESGIDVAGSPSALCSQSSQSFHKHLY